MPVAKQVSNSLPLLSMIGIFKVKRLRTIFFVYWFLLAYIIAALIYWFIVLNRQNNQMINYKLQKLRSDEPGYSYQLGKIANEIGREINTTGAKAYDADIQKCVVFMKDELEKLKEQILNVL